eukprot:g179.t1
MVLEALGAAVSGAVALGTSNWDMWGMTGGLATSGRGAQVDQAFQRSLCALLASFSVREFLNPFDCHRKHDRIDYKVTRQGLHRDDISDLIQLTTGRASVYNLVGALLLTFALRWITSSDLVVVPDFPHWPVWYSTVFVIACFSSALGTRMRLNFTRLSVPDNSTISKLKVPFFIPGGV